MGYYLELLKHWVPRVLCSLQIVFCLVCFRQPLWHQPSLLNLEHSFKSQLYKGLSYRVSIFLNIFYISIYYSLVVLAVPELYVAFIMVWFCLYLYGFPLWKHNHCVYGCEYLCFLILWPFKSQSMECRDTYLFANWKHARNFYRFRQMVFLRN